MSPGYKNTMPEAMSGDSSCASIAGGLDLDLLDDPLEWLLASGVDPRLYLNPFNFLNTYGCRPWPRPEAFTFASSTATTISDRGFAAARLALQQLVHSSRKSGMDAACDLLAETLRENIRSLLGIGAAEAEIIFSPSGTDSQIQAVYLAQVMLGGPLVSVIVASDETGSGTLNTANGCHFGDCTAQGATVPKGKRIPGFAEDTTSVEIPLREKDGRLRSHAAIDREVIHAVAESVTAGKRVLLHVMDTSKFGSRCPSLECLSRIQAHWGQSVQIVVDACQMRVSRQRLRYYLNQGFLVLITGSKFFTGPPLSGALLVPAAASMTIAQTNIVPSELELYSNQCDWPVAWRGIRSKLPMRPNVGQLLRWAAAVEEMRAFYAVPLSYRRLALRMFSWTVSRLVATHPDLRLMPTLEGPIEDELDDGEMAVSTIFPFFISRDGKLLPVEDCARIYHALNCDVSRLLPRSATARQRQIAATCCHIGQPVAMLDPVHGIAGTLRISAGARVVSDSWCSNGVAASLRKFNEEIGQVLAILEKIGILADNLDLLGELGEKYELPPVHSGNVRPSPPNLATPSTLPGVAQRRPQVVNPAPTIMKPGGLNSGGDRY